MDRTNTTALKRYAYRWSVPAFRWALVAFLVALWEFGVRLGAIDSYYFSSPVRIAENLLVWFDGGFVFKHLIVTIAEAGVGFASGLLLGITMGFLFAANPRVDAVLQPFVVIMNAMPRIAFAPLIILWFGFGFLSKVVIVVSLVFFIVFFNTYRGFKEISPLLLKNAAVLGATRWHILRHIYLPATMSWTVASLRISVGFAIIAAILAEYLGASAGIGYLIDNAQANFDATGVMTGLVLLTVVVAILDALLQRVEARFTKWRPNNQITEGRI